MAAAASSSSSLSVLEDNSYGSVSGWVEARTECPHLQVLNSDLRHIPAIATPCKRCDHPVENWICLSCKEVLCSRFINGHMLEHYERSGHCLAISYSDLSVWCFTCDAYLDAQVIAQIRPSYETAHLLKFGVEPPHRSDINGIQLHLEYS